MRHAIGHALVFALGALAATLAIDLVLSILYHAGPVEGGMRPFIAFRAALHGATFLLTALGAVAGFALAGASRIGKVHIGLLGAGFGAFALAAALAGVRMGGFATMALLLVAGAATVAFYGPKAIAAADQHG